MVSLLGLGLALLTGTTQDSVPTLALCPVEVPKNVRFEGWEKEESRAILATSIEDVLIEQLKKEYVSAEGSKFIQIDIRERKLKPAPTMDFLTQIAGSTQAPKLLYIQVLDFKQKNHEPGRTLNRPNSAGSETKVTVKAWVFDKTQLAAIPLSPTKSLEGDFQGPIFGTTNKLELRGNPQDVAFMVQKENTKKCRAGGLAVWLAIKAPLMQQLGSASPAKLHESFDMLGNRVVF